MIGAAGPVAGRSGLMDTPTVLVEVSGQRYLATRHDDTWRLFALDAHGVVIDARHPAAFALTAGDAWAHGIPAAARLPIDELIIVAADARGRLGHEILSTICPPELLDR
jgi:hypothetical protein